MWFSQLCLHPQSLLLILRLQSGKVTISKFAYLYNNLKPLFIERRGLPASNLSAAYNQVINTDMICSINLPISGSKGGSSGGIEGWSLQLLPTCFVALTLARTRGLLEKRARGLTEERAHVLSILREGWAHYVWARVLMEGQACTQWARGLLGVRARPLLWHELASSKLTYPG